MRLSLIILVLTIAASVYSITANAYVIHNNSPFDTYVLGGDCAPCFKGNVPPGETRSCPGSERGCRGDTYITLKLSNEWNNFLNSRCAKTSAPARVTAHGDVYIHTSKGDFENWIWADFYDDNGTLLYSGTMHEFQDCK